MFSLIYACINDWVNNREAGDLRRQHGHYDVIVMMFHIRFDIPHRRRFDLEQMTDIHADLEIIILEVMLNKK